MQEPKRKKYRTDGSSVWAHKVIHGPGVWVTCVKGKEKQTIGELYDVFGTLAEEMWPEFESVTLREGGKEGEEDEEDIEKTIAKEVAALKAPRKQQRFANCRTDTPCVIFISCKAPVDPVLLTQKLINNVVISGICPTRYTHRLVPVSNTCDANLSQIVSLANRVVVPKFESTSEDGSGRLFRYKIELRMRSHSSMTRDDILKTIASCVPQEHKVDLSNPDLFILVEVFKSVCGMSVVNDYYEFDKYNLIELSQRGRNDVSATTEAG